MNNYMIVNGLSAKHCRQEANCRGCTVLEGLKVSEF